MLPVVQSRLLVPAVRRALVRGAKDVMAVVLPMVAVLVAERRREFSYPTVRQELLSGRREWRWMRICDGRGCSGAESRGRSSRCKPTRRPHLRQQILLL